MKNLENLLRTVDHKSYPAYKSLAGRYRFPYYTLSIDHVQGDPFASPSALSIHLDEKQHGFPREYCESPHRRVMLQDYLLRRFSAELKRVSGRAGGSGKSGAMQASSPHQEVLSRSALTIDPATLHLTARFYAGFPAAGRTTLAMELKKMLMEYLPSCAQASLFFSTTDKKELAKWIALADDQKAVRDALPELDLAAFIADGAVLARRSGVDDRPMDKAVPFNSPDEDRVTIKLPNGRSVSGLGIKRGVTLIVGGGYHGKSTLLKALERGVYNHIPGDGRELVITEDSAMKLRSEDGRSVKDLDISAFIRDLPNKKDTAHFSTDDASGSTSQAACTVEAALAGSRTLLIDEDTSATNFMVRDALMQSVIHAGEEPIIPFILRMRQLYETLGISTILVAGSSGAFFTEADTILQMREYLPVDITDAAKAAADNDNFSPVMPPDSLKDWTDSRIAAPNREVTDSRRVKVRGSGTDSVRVNHESVELRFVEQVVDPEQTNFLGGILRTLEERYFDGKTPLKVCVEKLCGQLLTNGFKAACGELVPGNLAEVRPLEIWAMLNRYRGLKLK